MKKLLLMVVCILGIWIQVDASALIYDADVAVLGLLHQGKVALGSNNSVVLQENLRDLRYLLQYSVVSSTAIEQVFNFIDDVMFSGMFEGQKRYVSMVLITISKRLGTDCARDICVTPELLMWIKHNGDRFFCHDSSCHLDLAEVEALCKKGLMWIELMTTSPLIDDQTRLGWLQLLLSSKDISGSCSRELFSKTIVTVFYSMLVEFSEYESYKAKQSSQSSEYVLQGLKLLLPYFVDSRDPYGAVSFNGILPFMMPYVASARKNLTQQNVVRYQVELLAVADQAIERYDELIPPVDFDMVYQIGDLLWTLKSAGVDISMSIATLNKHSSKIFPMLHRLLYEDIHLYLAEGENGKVSDAKEKIDDVFNLLLTLYKIDFLTKDEFTLEAIMLFQRIIRFNYTESSSQLAALYDAIDPMLLQQVHACLRNNAFNAFVDLTITVQTVQEILDKAISHLGTERNLKNTMRIMSYLKPFFEYQERSLMPDQKELLDKLEAMVLGVLNDLLRANRLVYDGAVQRDIRWILTQARRPDKHDEVRSKAAALNPLFVNYQQLGGAASASVARRSPSPQRSSTGGAASARV